VQFKRRSLLLTARLLLNYPAQSSGTRNVAVFDVLSKQPVKPKIREQAHCEMELTSL
jgi:hypothetical protein